MIEVYHNKNFINHSWLEKVTDEVRKDFQEASTFVAMVDTDDLEVAYELTNNINASWTTNDKVATHLTRCRSTSVGDFMKHNDDVYVVAAFGFEKF